MQIKSGIWFGTGFDMGIYQKPLIVTAIALKSCPGTTRFGPVKTVRFVQSQNLCKPGIPIETKKTWNAIRSRVHRI